jgi:hypothetical protein
MADAGKNFLNKIITVFCLWPWNKATEFWKCSWDISSDEDTEIPKVPHQYHVDLSLSPPPTPKA